MPDYIIGMIYHIYFPDDNQNGPGWYCFYAKQEGNEHLWEELSADGQMRRVIDTETLQQCRITDAY